MLKFLRKIRYKLLGEAKNTRYLKYAIGEIILVVIGILIALQINNWNEQRKANISENKALKALKNEFEQNIERLRYICEQRDSALLDKRAYWHAITNDTISTKKKAEANMNGFFGGNWAVKNTVVNGLVNSGAIDNIKNDSLKTMLTSWPNQVEFWNNQEIKWNATRAKFEDYKRSKIRSGIPNTVDGERWIYTYSGTEEKYRSSMAMLVNEVEYQNFVAKEIHHLYIMSIGCNEIMKDYENLITALNYEIKNR